MYYCPNNLEDNVMNPASSSKLSNEYSSPKGAPVSSGCDQCSLNNADSKQIR